MLKPDYDGRCITKIPDTVKSILGFSDEETLSSSESDKVILVVIDGLGYNKLQELSEEDQELEAVLDEFNLEKISTVFPTSTAAALTSLYTGKTPEEHSFFDWTVYSKKLNMRYFPLPFEPAEEGDERKFEERAEEEIEKPKEIFEELEERGVNVYQVLPEDMVGDDTPEKTESYSNIVEAFVKLKKQFQEEDGKSFYYLYLSVLDSSEHYNGPEVEESEALIKELFRLLKEKIVDELEDGALLLTADHGFAEVNEILDLDEDSDLGEKIFPFLDTHYGKRILPTGIPRSINLHVKEEKVEEVMKEVKRAIGDKGEVYRTEELIENNLFGNGNPSEEFLENMGNVHIILDGALSINFDPYEEDWKGMHGGLTEDELYVPFLTKKL